MLFAVCAPWCARSRRGVRRSRIEEAGQSMQQIWTGLQDNGRSNLERRSLFSAGGAGRAPALRLRRLAHRPGPAHPPDKAARRTGANPRSAMSLSISFPITLSASFGTPRIISAASSRTAGVFFSRSRSGSCSVTAGCSVWWPSCLARTCGTRTSSLTSRCGAQMAQNMDYHWRQMWTTISFTMALNRA